MKLVNDTRYSAMDKLNATDRNACNSFMNRIVDVLDGYDAIAK